jgi:hypothetical protein
MKKLISLLFVSVLIGCGGGSPQTPAIQPTVSLSSTNETGYVNPLVTLTWTSTNATSCTLNDPTNSTVPTNGSVIKPFANFLKSNVTITCVGGSGTTPVTASVSVPNFSAPATLQAGKYRLTLLDYRYEGGAPEFNVYGNDIASLDGMKILIDRAKNVGFNGFILTTQASIDPNTGLISYTVDKTVVKTLPKDFWKVVDYIKSQGMYVWISITIVDGKLDIPVKYTFNNFSKEVLFKSVTDYSVGLAAIAQQHKVDGLLMEGQHLDTQEFQPYWTDMVSKLRMSFSGKLALSSYGETPIIALFDYFNYLTYNALSNTPIYDLAKIVSLYNNDTQGLDEPKLLRNIYNKYGTKIMISFNSLSADVGVGLAPPDYWTAMVTNIFTTTPYSKPALSNKMKILKIQAFLEMVALQISDITDGVAIEGFSPWLEVTKFSNPTNPLYPYYADGANLTEDIDAQKVLNSYFSKPWGYHTLQ